MGISVQGILCYGFRIKDESGQEEEIMIDWLCRENDEEMCFDDLLAKLAGLEPPFPPSEFDSERYESDPAYKQLVLEYWHKKKEIEKESEVDLVTHSSVEYPMHILAIKASITRVSFGDAAELGQSIVAQSEWREKLRAFCKKANIKFEEPQFILCSYYGC